MLVCHILMMGVITVMFKKCLSDTCKRKVTYRDNAIETWKDDSIKKQAMKLYILKNYLFKNDSTLELSPELYKCAGKWIEDENNNKIRFGKQYRPKQHQRWIAIEPSRMSYPYNKYMMYLPLNSDQIKEVMKLIDYEDNDLMTEQFISENYIEEE